MEASFLQDTAWIHLSVFHEEPLPGGFSGTRHRHAFHEVGMVLEGDCAWHLGRDRRVELGRGDVIVVPEGTWHREKSGARVRLAWAGFSGLRNASLLPLGQPVRMAGDSEAAEWLLREIYREQVRERAVSARLTRLALEQLLVLIAAAGARIRAVPAKPRRGIPGHRQRMVRSIAAHFAQNPERPLSLGEMARYHRISSRHLSLLFRRVLGMRPTDYRQQCRLERAKSLLRAADGPSVKEIAAACGFADAAHFCKAFRAATGHSPTEWRMDS